MCQSRWGNNKQLKLCLEWLKLHPRGKSSCLQNHLSILYKTSKHFSNSQAYKQHTALIDTDTLKHTCTLCTDISMSSWTASRGGQLQQSWEALASEREVMGADSFQCHAQFLFPPFQPQHHSTLSSLVSLSLKLFPFQLTYFERQPPLCLPPYSASTSVCAMQKMAL